MPQVEVNGITINYEVQGEGEPLLLIPYTSADHACYAFQLPAYTEHFSCIALDLPGSGESDTPAGPYSTDGYADQVAAFLGAIGIERAHVAGVSLGAAVGMHLAARHPGRVRSLSLHSGWHASDDYLRIVVEQWRTLASSLPTVADVVIQGIFPWCFTPEMYVEPAGVRRHAGRLRARPTRPAGGPVSRADRCGHRPRRERGARRDRRSDADHVRGARPRVLDALCRAAQERDRPERAGGLRPPVARRVARGPRRPSTARHSTSSCASARSTGRTTPSSRNAPLLDQSGPTGRRVADARCGRHSRRVDPLLAGSRCGRSQRARGSRFARSGSGTRRGRALIAASAQVRCPHHRARSVAGRCPNFHVAVAMRPATSVGTTVRKR